MDRQKIFENVTIHLIMQNKQAAQVLKYGCRYRADNGLRCAIGGGCMPDRFYHPAMESLRIRIILDRTDYLEYRIWLGIETEGDTEFLSTLQSIHDSKQSIAWRNELITFAKRYDLHWPIYL